jgi:hypothetical protein
MAMLSLVHPSPFAIHRNLHAHDDGIIALADVVKAVAAFLKEIFSLKTSAEKPMPRDQQIIEVLVIRRRPARVESFQLRSSELCLNRLALGVCQLDCPFDVFRYRHPGVPRQYTSG